MKEFVRKGFIAAAPVYGVCIAIAVLRAAHVPFPPKLSLEAWPQWAVFMAVVHTCITLSIFITSRVLGEPLSPSPSLTPPKV